MKVCPHCQRPYADSATHCESDGQVLRLPSPAPAPPGAASDTTWSPLPPRRSTAAASPAPAAGEAPPLHYWGLLKRGWSVAWTVRWSLVGFFALFLFLQLLILVLFFRGHPWPAQVLNLASLLTFAGLWLYALDLLRGQATPLSRFFIGYRRFFPLLLASIVGGGLIALGFLCLLLPGIYLAIAYAFATPLIVDRGDGFWQALETSRKTVSRQWFSVFGFFLFLLALNIAGMLCFAVGFLVTAWVSFFALAAAYEQLFSGSGAEKEKA